MAEQVQTNTDAITVLNGTENGSVYKQTQAVLTSAKLYTDNELAKLNTTSAVVVDEKPSVSGNTITYLKDAEVNTATSSESIANALCFHKPPSYNDGKLCGQSADEGNGRRVLFPD